MPMLDSKRDATDTSLYAPMGFAMTVPLVSLLGVHKLPIDDLKDDADIQRSTRQMMARALNIGHVVAFVGAGVSKAYGYPDWKELVSQLEHELQLEPDQRRPPCSYCGGPQLHSWLHESDQLLMRLERCEQTCIEQHK